MTGSPGYIPTILRHTAPRCGLISLAKPRYSIPNIGFAIKPILSLGSGSWNIHPQPCRSCSPVGRRGQRHYLPEECRASLRESEERYSLAMSAINEGVYDWDVARDEIFYSPNVMEVIGFTRVGDVDAEGLDQRIHPEDLPAYRAAWAAHFRGETRRFLCEMRYRHADGSTHWARQHGTEFGMVTVGSFAWSGRPAISGLRRSSNVSAMKLEPFVRGAGIHVSRFRSV